MSGLRLIQFSSEDYRIADVLSRPHLEKITNDVQIASALSLYFQWPDQRRAFVKLGEYPYAPCELVVDTDLATPDEIFVNLNEKINVDANQSIRIRFEIFGTCFEYTAPILADLSHDYDFTSIVMPIPQELYVHKARSSPRYGVPAEHPLRKATFYCNETSIQCEIKNISVKNILVYGISDDTVEGEIDISGYRFQAKIIKKTEFGHVIQLVYRDQKEYGAYFDRFIQVAYPNLRPRYDFDHETIYNLYVETGYLSRFGNSNDKSDKESTSEISKEDLISFWDDSKSGEHIYKVDYVLVDNDDRPIGISGLAKIFIDSDNHPIWAPHQLCVIKSTEHLSGTASLYKWYAEYLDGLNYDFVTWFRSTSKWNDRMYTKLTLSDQLNTKLTPIHLKVGERIKVDSSTNDIKLIGNVRKCATTPNILIGSGPEFLNSSRLFELVWIKNNLAENHEIQDAIEKYNQISTLQCTFRISIPQSLCSLIDLKTRPTDRCFEISPKAYSNYYRCIEHSVALTRRKLSA